jgi:OOP family OmpA-OmpF porin
MLPAAIGLAAASSAHSAPADGSAGWYAGLGAGSTSLNNFEWSDQIAGALADLGITAEVPSLSSDPSDTGWKLFAGYQFNDYVALEAFYADFGTFDIGVEGTVDGGEGNPTIALTGNANVDATGYGVFWVFNYPLFAGLSAFGKVGGVHWSSDSLVTIVVDGETGTDSVGDDGNDFAWGAGAKYRITDHIAVDVQFEQFDAVSDIDLVSGSVRWMF